MATKAWCRPGGGGEATMAGAVVGGGSTVAVSLEETREMMDVDDDCSQMSPP